MMNTKGEMTKVACLSFPGENSGSKLWALWGQTTPYSFLYGWCPNYTHSMFNKWTQYFLLTPRPYPILFLIFSRQTSQKSGLLLTAEGSGSQDLSSEPGTAFCRYIRIFWFFRLSASPPPARGLPLLGALVKRHSVVLLQSNLRVHPTFWLSVLGRWFINLSPQPWLFSWKLILLSNFLLVNSMQILFF